MKLLGKASLVTGAAQGIGHGCARQLADEGSDIALNDLQATRDLLTLADQIRETGRRAVICAGDVSKRDDVETMIDAAYSQFGKLDIVVACASNEVRKPFLELTPEDMAVTLDVCFWGAFHTCQIAARRMVEQKRGGSIVVVSSVHAVMPFRRSLPYNAAKAAVNNMAYTIANELAEFGIRVNIVEPGWTDTPGQRKFYTEAELQEDGRKLPLGRLASIEEIAKGVVFLVGEDASYITGTMLRIDGGFALPRRGRRR